MIIDQKNNKIIHKILVFLVFTGLLFFFSVFCLSQRVSAAAPANLKIHDIEVNLLNGQRLFVPGTVKTEVIGKTTSNGRVIPIGSSPYFGNHLDTDNNGQPNTNVEEFFVNSSLFTRPKYIWCGAAGGVPALEFEMMTTLLDRGDIGNDFVIVNGTRRYGTWRTLTAVEGMTGISSSAGRSIVTKAYNPYTTSVHFIFQERIDLGQINVWKYAPSIRGLNGDLNGVPEVISKANVAVTYPSSGFYTDANGRNNPAIFKNLWSGDSLGYKVDFEVPRGWRIIRVVVERSDRAGVQNWISLPAKLVGPESTACNSQFCVYGTEPVFIPPGGGGEVAVNLIFDKLGDITVNRCYQAPGTTFEDCNDFDAPEGNIEIYNYLENNSNNKIEKQKLGESSQNGYSIGGWLWTIDPFAPSNVTTGYNPWYYKVKVRYQNSVKPKYAVVTGNDSTKLSPQFSCDTNPTEGFCWVDLVTINAIENGNVAILDPKAIVNFIYENTQPPTNVYNPWLQTQGGNVISQGSIRGPKSEKIPPDTGVELTGARKYGSIEKEAEYLIMSAVGDNGGYFCSSQYYILTNLDQYQTGSCTNGTSARGYSVNIPSISGVLESDPVIASVNNIYTQNGNGNAQCPANSTSVFTQLLTSVPATINSTCVNGSIYKLTTGNKTSSGISSVNGRSTIFVDGDLTINGNITYTGTSTDIRTIPNLAIVVKGNVNITGSVSRIDAAIYATGKINTCSDLPERGSVPTVCNTRLTVNGMLVSRGGFSFNRTFVNIAELNNPLPAELIKLTPQTYIFPPPGLDTKYFQDDALEAAVIDDGQYPPQF